MLSTSQEWFRSVSRGACVCFLQPALCFGKYLALTERQLPALRERSIPQMYAHLLGLVVPSRPVQTLGESSPVSSLNSAHLFSGGLDLG